MKPIDCQEFYHDGRHYDGENTEILDDIPFYLDLAQKVKGPVLELACGTGRITLPLAKAGVDITGLDISPAMLKQAQTKAAREHLTIQWVEADCRTFNLDKKFSFIFIPFNSMQHLQDLESVEALFSRVHKHLTEDGLFTLDVFNPSLQLLNRDPNTRYPVAKYTDPDGNGQVVIEESCRYDSATQINHLTWHYEVGGKKDAYAHDLNMRNFFPQELDMLLHYNGFSIVDKFGDFRRGPFSSDSNKQILLCRSCQ